MNVNGSESAVDSVLKTFDYLAFKPLYRLDFHTLDVAAIVLADDYVVRNVYKSSRKVTGVCRL